MKEARLGYAAGEVRACPGQVQQALMNICHNAANVQDGKGEVAVSLQRRELRQPQALSHGALDPGVYGVISVEDRGPGVPPDILGHIFEPFFTTRRGGTGLGLSTSWEITQAHGGIIDVRSEPGRGAVFSIWLPVAQRRRAVAPEGAARSPALSRPDTGLAWFGGPGGIRAWRRPKPRLKGGTFGISASSVADFWLSDRTSVAQMWCGRG